jgi:dTDP-4-dehydrorhamnose 3,5-epimerase
MIEVQDLDLGGACVLRLRRFPDKRGWFSETFSERWLDRIGVKTRFVQDNTSWSERAGTLRGIHAQRPPMAQAKLVSVTAGAIFDTIVDCRAGSPTYGKTRSVVLSADEPQCLYVPAGFCHGFVTLKPATMVSYKVDNYYSPEHETGLRWNDPALGIDWPLEGREPIMSDKDRALPLLADFVPL